MSESVGVLRIEVTSYRSVIAVPLGVRITSEDRSAVGESQLTQIMLLCGVLSPCMHAAGEDFESVVKTVYLRPGQYPRAEIEVYIHDDSSVEGEERFTVEMKSYDLSVIVFNPKIEIVIVDNDEEISE